MRPRLVSVVVPVRDAAGTLPAQLDALERQDYDEPYEVVVADNGSRDGSAELAGAWAQRTGGLGRVVRADARRGPGHARNAGAAAARGDLLAFCDADDVVSVGWLRALVEAAAEADMVGGPEDVERLNGPDVRRWYSAAPPDRLALFHDFLPSPSGANSGIWAAALTRLGGFHEGSDCGEDVDLAWRAQLAGMRVAFAPGALIHRRRRDGLGPFARRFFGYGQGDAWLYARYRGQGMPGSGPRDVAARYRELVIALPRAARDRGERGRCVQIAALRAGRLAGSVRHRVLYL
jgi:glycosyltransferase involved in cell wall biosynthesis